MRKTIGIFMATIFCLAMITTGQTQQKVVNFKKLQEFLPQIDLPGFTKGKPAGQTSTAMGMATSEASLRYEKAEKGETISVEVQIEDTAGIPFAGAGMSMLGLTEFENQTENGYEKSVKIQGFSGTEKMENGEYKSAEINLIVASRFMVNIKGDGTSDVASLRKLVDSMNLAELAKLAQ
jgi:hypothetical protein